MNVGDKVQVRRFDGVDHWLYAVVQDPATNRVQITHPGNAEDGKVILASAADIRTSANLQSLITQAQTIVSAAGRNGLSEAQIKQLAALDGFWCNFLPPKDGRLTDHQIKVLTAQQSTLHQRVISHYQEQLKRL